ncbi:MAG: prepilin-type N-terminal cleavage/methylation domain-containing protein, partial [Betaproteobacteria bacterium]|nr:prepilin-type N-terminal cleavage/methylation domain-containing protein [Betaproteobacteria bacterium]
MRSNRFQQRSDAIGQKGLSLIELLVALLLSAMLA